MSDTQQIKQAKKELDEAGILLLSAQTRLAEQGHSSADDVGKLRTKLNNTIRTIKTDYVKPHRS